ncbi:unnamed protein product [Rhizoctonia solani]|uniref:UspA domain-containing protein n=1 Tax=Rhizoctonia solani TaxID=456999 RepID=A0A8H3E4B2_9AGAM|nr:unnamed protein product [Rhizoctonia solani]
MSQTAPLRSAMKQPSRPASPVSTPVSPTPASAVATPLSPPHVQLAPSSPHSLLSPLPTFTRTVTGASTTVPGYKPKVSFDTFENPSDASLDTFTLQASSEGYKRTRNTRVFLCAASADESGREALDWTLESLVQHGDELIVVRGFDLEDLEKQLHEEVRDEAKELMKHILAKNLEHEGRQLSVVVEFVAGKITSTIERLIALYGPDSLVVGTRGQTGLVKTWSQAFLTPGIGSVSRYCVSHSPVPVIVVRPERKVRKSMEKRRADGRRRHQFDEYLVPVILILPALWRHLKAQTWWPWRSLNQTPHEPASASDVTVAATISDITVLRLLLPAFLFQQPPIAARSPIIEAIQTVHNTLPLRSVLRATAILYVPYLALTYLVSLPVLFGLLGTAVLTARSPWIYTLRTLVSESGWARWAWRRVWACLTGQPVVIPGSGFSVQDKPVSLPPKLGKKNVTVAQSLQPSRLRFRFDILENQRWWVGIDWSATLLPNERTSWCSPPPHLAPLSPPITFTLPPPTSHIDKTLKIKRNAFWRWDDPEWTVMVKTSADSHPSRVQLQLPDPSSDTEGRLAKGLKRVGENLPESVSGSSFSRKPVDTGDYEEEQPPLSPLNFDKDLLTDPDGWIYADNKWEMPSPKGGLGKYTRYRVWTRCAVLVEDIEELDESALSSTSDKPANSSNLQAPTTTLIAPNSQPSSPQKGHKHTLSEGGASMGLWRASSTSFNIGDRESTLTSRLKSVLEHRGNSKS